MIFTRPNKFSLPSKQLYDSFPSLMKHLPGPHNRIFSNCKSLEASIRGEIERHKSDLDPSNPRDYIDTFLMEVRVWCLLPYYNEPVHEPRTDPFVNWLYFCPCVPPDSTKETVNWVLTKATWFCVVSICSWLVVKLHRRPCSGASSTSSRTLISRVGVQLRNPKQQLLEK